MTTSRRAFLASLVAAIAGRSLFRKPKPDRGISIRLIRRWDHGHVRMDVLHGYGRCSIRARLRPLFNPRENLAAQYKGLQFHRDAFTLVASEFDRGFAKIGAPLSVPRPAAAQPS